ncbi:MAG: putative sulfate exporter family transporter [Firmicutes bacterium]|nr:putative sulfate exporter family transporter [Bacillota bacterium]
MLKQFIPGVVFVYILTLTARLLAGLISPVLELEALTIGIILGIILAGTVKLPETLRPGLNWSQKYLLAAGVVLLGFRLNLQALSEAGIRVLLLVLIFVPLVILAGVLIGKLTGTDTKVATMLGLGTAICGSSAVAALAPTLDADEEDTVLAVSVVSILGAAGLLIYSAAAVGYQGSDTGFGVWSGLTLHNVAHAIGAAFARSELAGEIGTVVKLARVAMLAIIAPLLGVMFKSQKAGAKAGIPNYVLLFVAAAILGSMLPLSGVVTDVVSDISSTLITMAMIAMGLAVNFGTIRAKGGRALLAGTTLFAGASLVAFWLTIQLF